VAILGASDNLARTLGPVAEEQLFLAPKDNAPLAPLYLRAVLISI
tara:strand:- start:134 stop:268 length:135 start_codon:yes stop_codon:yes gene_type:complete